MLTTTLEKALNWARSNALWPATFGLACCAIEMMSMVTSRYDSARFGAEVFRASPRQADMLILSGRVSIKMAPVIRRIYDQMLEPKWVIAMGACASSSGVFNNYALVAGADKFLPGGRPRARLPASARIPHPRRTEAPAHGAGQSRPRLARAATRPRARRSGRTRTPPRLPGRAPDARRDRTRADRARTARAVPGLRRGHAPLPRHRHAAGQARARAGRAPLAPRRRRRSATSSSPVSTAPTTCLPSRASASITSC